MILTGTRRADVVVVGAGTAGAHAAYQLARRGLDVVLVERRRAAAAGAQWHNGVLDWQFAAAGLDPPAPPERQGSSGVTHLCGPDGTRALTVHDSPVVRADMVLLGTRLRRLAVAAGAELVEQATTVGVEERGGRLTALEVEARASSTSGPEASPGRRRFEATLFVDASGRRGVLRRRSATLSRWCPEVRGDELCTAADHHRVVADLAGARRFLERHGARPGEGVTAVGVAGGWSTRAITVAEDFSHVSVLTGCLANGRYSTGARMMDDARREESWMGESLSGGAGLIPLRRPYARFTAPGLALVGDAAGQVFPAHGSGIGFGLIAGTMLADAVAPEGSGPVQDPGDEAVLWTYQAGFQRTYGGLLAAFDAFRRMSTALGSSGVAAMVRAGLLSEAMTRAGLDQAWAPPDPAQLPALAARLATVPGVAARMLPLLARGQVLHRAGARYPDRVDEAALVRWDRRVARLLGPLPR